MACGGKPRSATSLTRLAEDFVMSMSDLRSPFASVYSNKKTIDVLYAFRTPLLTFQPELSYTWFCPQKYAEIVPLNERTHRRPVLRPIIDCTRLKLYPYARASLIFASHQKASRRETSARLWIYTSMEKEKREEKSVIVWKRKTK